jgi:hypothetical protein
MTNQRPFYYYSKIDAGIRASKENAIGVEHRYKSRRE